MGRARLPGPRRCRRELRQSGVFPCAAHRARRRRRAWEAGAIGRPTPNLWRHPACSSRRFQCPHFFRRWRDGETRGSPDVADFIPAARASWSFSGWPPTRLLATDSWLLSETVFGRDFFFMNEELSIGYFGPDKAIFSRGVSAGPEITGRPA